MVFSLTRDGGTWLAMTVIARHLRKNLLTGVAVRKWGNKGASPRFVLIVTYSSLPFLCILDNIFFFLCFVSSFSFRPWLLEVRPLWRWFSSVMWLADFVW
jgi:hypothetical protein